MQIMSRRVLSLLTGIAVALVAGAAAAQDGKLMRIIVPNSPGLTADTLARLVAPEMSKALGQNIIVENKPGADSRVGIEYVVKQAPPDGNTLIVVSSSILATMPLSFKDLNFDPLKDLTPFLGLAEARFLFGSASRLPWKTFNDMVAHAKANPGKLNYGSSATTTTLLTEAILRDKGINVVYIPYSAGAAHMQALIAGDIDMSFTIAALASNWGERFRTVAVTGRTRLPEFPDAPTFTELGLPQIRSLTHELYVRSDTPKPVIARLYDAGSRALQSAEFKAGVAKFRQEITGDNPEQAAKRLADDARIFGDVARKMGLKPQ